jgi:hypothetical protein
MLVCELCVLFSSDSFFKIILLDILLVLQKIMSLDLMSSLKHADNMDKSNDSFIFPLTKSTEKAPTELLYVFNFEKKFFVFLFLIFFFFRRPLNWLHFFGRQILILHQKQLLNISSFHITKVFNTQLLSQEVTIFLDLINSPKK